MRRRLEPTVGRGVAAAGILAAALAAGSATGGQATDAAPPASLRDTGLYADFERLEVDPAHLAFAPQYPLWTDGAQKRRWVSLPPGTAVDASDPDAWVFPAGTRFWKEFSFGGRRIETRMIERTADGRWRYAAYEWSADGREATLAPERGRRGSFDLGNGRAHTIPGVSDCKVCHEASRSTVLGFSLLQLSPDRDPDALHAEPVPAPGVDLAYLVDAGLLVGLPDTMLTTPPRIAAASATERAVLGYLHGNCGQCHTTEAKLEDIGIFLRHLSDSAVEPAVASMVGQPVRDPAPGQSPDAVLRVEPGHPERSALAQRMASRWAALQMPPLGTELVDEDALDLVRQWIGELDVSLTQAQQGGTRQ